jgi:hypothetical protein
VEHTTIATPLGLLQVVVEQRGGRWVAHLGADDAQRIAVPPSVALDRKAAVLALTWAVRSLTGSGGVVPGPRPGSWEGCP